MAAMSLAASPASAAEPLSGDALANVVQAALSFLGLHRAEYGMTSPASEVEETSATVDTLGMTHVRFHQMERGVHVAGGEIIVHYAADGSVRSTQQRWVGGVDKVNITPTISASFAGTLARMNTNTREVVGEPELVIRSQRLAWDVNVRSDIGHAWRASVDAHTGAVFAKSADFVTLVGSGVRLDGKRVPLNYAIATNGSNALADTSREARILTRDAQQKQADAFLITSTNPQIWDTASTLGPGAAVDAHVNVGIIADYFKTAFERSGWDNYSGDMNIWVHVGDYDGTPGFDNALYSRSSNLIAFGDGKTVYKPLAGYLDVAAHEFMHAITGQNAALERDGQPGALNEAISDVFGAIIEHSARPDVANNWRIGEGALRTSSAPIRDLANPSASQFPIPSHMSQLVTTDEDDGGVHSNCGIVGNAAYLMTMGGTHLFSNIRVPNGIGWEKTAAVWYRADTTYLTANADFQEMARATTLAAADLGLTNPEIQLIDCAWKAVGVLEGTCEGAALIQGGGGDGLPPAGSGSTAGGGNAGGGSSEPNVDSLAMGDLDVPSPEVNAGCGCRTSQTSGGWPSESWLYGLAFVLYQLRGVRLRGGRTRSRPGVP